MKLISKVSLIDIQSIVDAKHGEPHNVLGIHEVSIKEGQKIKKVMAIRAFIPQAKEIYVINLHKKEEYSMIKIHKDGFFEVITNEPCFFEYILKITNYENHTWETYDAYSFKFTKLISEIDIYLFAKGTHYEIYNKLGANIREIEGIKGVNFAVWAPNAKRVSVIGDFNNWDGRRNPMRLLKTNNVSSGIWEIFIPHLCNFDKYKFEILDSNNNLIEKTDPFGFFQELRPSTSSLVFDINSYNWNDKDYFKNLEKLDKYNRPINIYEVHLGSWNRAENNRFLTYKELSDMLIPYVKDMG